MTKITWKPVPKPDFTHAVNLDAAIPQDQLLALYKTLQAEYREVRKRNITLQRKLNRNFRHHPLTRRGRGWVWHQCWSECFRKKLYISTEMIHRLEDGDDK